MKIHAAQDMDAWAIGCQCCYPGRLSEELHARAIMRQIADLLPKFLCHHKDKASVLDVIT